jgi:hypothetical protein
MGAYSQPTRAMETSQMKLADDLRARAKESERRFRFGQIQTTPQTATGRGGGGSLGGGYFNRLQDPGIGKRQK